ncbi:hypothetical protein [Chryseobacterium lathyri]|uniref:hypothetical protein n=1 Tax=Chryseobacterium lathyri TaxID=395933 RepID=UPI001CC13BDC|nr:hypothetical protein [Chryseobacterium lathyri]
MKKSLLVLSSLILVSCGGNDLLNSQEEIQTSKIVDKQILTQPNTNSLENKTEIVVMDLNFLNKAQPQNGGCTVTNIDNKAVPHETTAAFGPNPLSYFGYQIRGYGAPRMYWGVWNGLRFESKNESKTIINRGRTMLINNPLSNAISIEFPFQQNFTYEITIDASITDEIYLAKHDEFRGNDDLYQANQSEAFSTVAIELTNSPQIRGADPCAKYPARAVVNTSFVSSYYKKQKAEITTPPSYENKTFVFKFSMKEAQSALILYFLPGLSETQSIPESSFSMYIGNIKIVQKPFEQEQGSDTSTPCGFRVGC